MIKATSGARRSVPLPASCRQRPAQLVISTTWRDDELCLRFFFFSTSGQARPIRRDATHISGAGLPVKYAFALCTGSTGLFAAQGPSTWFSLPCQVGNQIDRAPQLDQPYTPLKDTACAVCDTSPQGWTFVRAISCTMLRDQFHTACKSGGATVHEVPEDMASSGQLMQLHRTTEPHRPKRSAESGWRTSW